jgi:hypothetical protein
MRCFLILGSFLAWINAQLLADSPMPGQIVADPDFPQALMRYGGEHFFICGPGDPEGFLYRGNELADGTRDGDQNVILRKLQEHGGNCLYLQAVRSHGGDGSADHNPFINHDPSKGLNTAVLDQWEVWFAEMDEHGILIYFFIYDDSSLVWDSGDEVTYQEAEFVRTLVRRFKHHRHLIWVLAEESEEALSNQRAQKLGRIIEEEDDHGHLIGNHHHSGTDFKSFRPEGPFNHFAMQLNVPLNEVSKHTLEAVRKSRNQFQVVYAENTETPNTVGDWRRHAWSVAMSGSMPMLLGMDVASTPVVALRQCRILSEFFEDTPFFRMQPALDEKLPGVQSVLSDQAGNYILWSAEIPDGTFHLKLDTAGGYDLLWLDTQTGRRVEEIVELASGCIELNKPESIGSDCAVFVQQQIAIPKEDVVYPGEQWEKKSPDELGLDAELLKQFSQKTGGRGCIIKDGFMVHQWGDISHPGDLASASKPLYSHLLFQALEKDLLESVDDKVANCRPCLKELNPALNFKDSELTFRHLAFQTACLGYRECPGEAYDYNDHTMGFFWDVLVEDVFGIQWSKARMELFEPNLAGPLQFEDAFSFPVEGRMRGRPSMSPRDFARFGWLYLNQGRWKDQQIISARHARTAAHDPLPLGIPRTAAEEAERCDTRSIGGGGNQADHQGGYSWLWWLNTVSRDGRRWWPDAPEDMFCALGHCGQRGVAVLPALGVVVSWNDTRELHCNRELGNEVFELLKLAVMGGH